MLIREIKPGASFTHHIAGKAHKLTVAEVRLHTQHDSFEIVFTDGTILGDYGIDQPLSSFPYLTVG